MGNEKTTLAHMHPKELELRAYGLTFPDVTEDFPWDHCALKIKGKVFVFLGNGKDRISMTAKLPTTHGSALMLPFAEPTGYGLGKAGWVTARFESEDEVPVGILKEWIEESFRAVAPKKIVARIGESSTVSAPVRATTTKKAPAKKATPKKATGKRTTAMKTPAKKKAAR